MRTLLNEQYAPITSAFGFFRLPVEDVARGLEAWRRKLYENFTVSRPTDGFPAVLHRVGP